MKVNKTAVILMVFFMALGISFLAYYYKVNKEQVKLALPVLGNPGHTVAPFSFTNQLGKTITNEDVKGKICIVEYFFATCKGICPKMNENMNTVYKAIKGNKRVLILSHTVDPYKDTAAALNAYSKRFDADPEQWMFLTGDKKQLYDMARYSYLINAKEDTTGVTVAEDFIHDNHFMLVDGGGHIRGEYDGLIPEDVNKLISDINELMKEKN